jgi:hypothetical protein
MVSEQPSIYKILKDSTRQKIILQLHKQGPLTYVDLMNTLKISNTGKFNYHLKILADFLEKEEDGKYYLTEKGLKAAQLLADLPATSFAENNKSMLRKEIMIGAAGFALILLNPAIFENFIGIPLVAGPGSTVLAVLYAFFLPGVAMWFLSARIIKTHNLRQLLKPLFLAVLLLICLIVLIALLQWLAAFLKWPIDFHFPLLQKGALEPQTIQQGDGGTIIIQQITLTTSPLLMLPFAGVYSVIGILASEMIHRFSKKQLA